MSLPPVLSKNLMILASAGSGKTFQLGNRVIGLVGSRDVDPARIVALTFTRKAAGEFADSVLSKLAMCALDPGEEEKLGQQIGAPFPAARTLARIVRALPTFQLGTMDGFFARIVRGFQYELGLTGGTFELIEGPKLEAAMSDMLAEILGAALEREGAEDFLNAFRRATMGKEGTGVLKDVERFLGQWHGLWKAGIPLGGWGAPALFGSLPEVTEWEKQKHELARKLDAACTSIAWTEKRQPEKMRQLSASFIEHTVGSGRIATDFFKACAEVVASGASPMKLRHYKEFDVGGAAERVLTEAVTLLAGCELAAAIARTRAVAELVASLDAECERRLRRKGLLGFDDVKVLMGRWTQDEDARLRREAVDFRLDARYDHWLLDEFQDTSRAEWAGMVPLLDEAATRDDGTLFVVGDRKQAIYGWRGGDVSLFDEVEHRYGGGLAIGTMPDSWRSCPAVLDLVNAVCGDAATIGDLFGAEMARRWQWEEHVSARPGVTGEARVEVVPKDDRDARLVELLREIGIGEKNLTCGVLVRTNDQVRAAAALLREHGFDVIEEGRRQPVADNAPGVALFHLIRWLADPNDAFAKGVVAMSPLDAILKSRHGEHWQAAWEGLLKEARTHGFAPMVEHLVEPLWEAMSEFSRRRAGDVIGALAEFDATGAATPREAARWINDLEIAQSPGAAAVQVLTIHKSKGLGFDVVVLPEIEDSQVPNHGDFNIARGSSGGAPWLMAPPASWVRTLFPAISHSEDQWADDQRYEAMCVLYVALTRAKRGLYVLLPEVPKSRKESHDWQSLANWVARSAGDDFQSGDPGWWHGVPDRQPVMKPASPALAGATPRRARVAASGAKDGLLVVGSSMGRAFGRDVHLAFEAVGWLDDGAPRLPSGDAGAMVRELLADPGISRLFQRGGRNVRLFREQAVEGIVDGKWLSGVVDRLHLIHDDDGKPAALELIDFKTDSVEQPEQLVERHAGQMAAYREVLSKAYDDLPVTCMLLSTKLRAVVIIE
ncbi:UvrD-helicase domain-containing protein [Luteolibacter flavescens]|uniref:DNA 3'-5' helicase n=1 Tax=Luteolibacter flavescens TaxID=1859460 RepID=A0ABT3FQ30_9BACT|nr:UvrD-helicase domain-containing protein [Luteolibacter flavescens]MCW1885680.1 UvrD-helicase domain-containing protein [Luteolibacter flavescens]